LALPGRSAYKKKVNAWDVPFTPARITVMKIAVIIFGVWVFAFGAEMPEVQIYRGEPFAEALHDIVLNGAVAISHPLAQAALLERTDVFRLRDAKILVICSTSDRLGEPFSVKRISLGSLGNDPKDFKPVSKMQLPSLTNSDKLK
jgi:hypothetical protein